MQSAILGASAPCTAIRQAQSIDALADVQQSGRTGVRSGFLLPARQPRSARQSSRRRPLSCRAASEAAVQTTENGATPAGLSGPKPTVKIDNQRDPFATVVSIEYGDKLGELLDTVAALKNLGLNIRRAKLKRDEGKGTVQHKFFITDSHTAEKITRSARLEDIRLTILNNLMLYHPESTEELSWGIRARTSGNESDGGGPTLGVRSRRAVDTDIRVEADENGVFSKLHINTVDRPGLLVEIVKVLKDINVNVISAEVDTEGTQAMDTFFVSYHGEPLNSSMVALVTNALQYFLSLNEVEREESY